MLRTKFWAVTLKIIFLMVFGRVEAQCPPSSWNKSSLQELRQNQFILPDSYQPSSFALQLVPCLRSKDPVLRDQVAYEALTLWMRDKKLDDTSALQLVSILSDWMQPETVDDEGFAKPFAALVMAELVRRDRIEAYLTATQRQQLIQVTVGYLTSIKDYRGYDAVHGWRHGVAHSADLVLQFALNPNIQSSQQQQLAKALSVQVVASGEHFYIYGEGQRLARAVFYLIQRDDINFDWWQTWFAQLTDGLKTEDLFNSQGGLATRHNLMSFFSAMYLYLNENGSESAKTQLLPTLRKGIILLG